LLVSCIISVSMAQKISEKSTVSSVIVAEGAVDEHIGHDHDDHDDHSGHDHQHHDHSHEEERAGEAGLGHGTEGGSEGRRRGGLKDERIWGAAIGSIFIIGACGIFGVLVIPIMNRKIYQHAVQFLIALAVGTLTGDALLHLLPHAIMGGLHNHDHKGKSGNTQEQIDLHKRAVWIGFVSAVSIIGFFLFEKIVNILGEMRTKSAVPDKNLRVVREGHVASDKAVGENICKHKYSPYCVQDFEKKDDKKAAVSLLNGTDDSKQNDSGMEQTLLPAVSDSVLNKNSNYAVAVGSAEKGYRADQQDSTVIISHHEVAHHGHSHAHSHIHSAPDSISSVAWMVIFGDGIHNLADGMAIGAAFADGMWSGVSTSIAVLCHELPHEIGDFAMLLKTGMSFKKAAFYNVVSSVLAFVGMVVGLVLGNIDNFSTWMFAATAGIFLYVALVDMMPELNSGHSHPLSKETQPEGHFSPIILQVLGMSLGVGIMTLIALYEEDFKVLLADKT